MLTMRFGYGMEPGKWLRRYRERYPRALDAQVAEDPLQAVLRGNAQLGLVRLPDPRFDAIEAAIHRVVLYEEAPGVGVPKDSVWGLMGDDLTCADLEDHMIHYSPPSAGPVDVAAVRENLRVVAANVGVVCAPFPLVRLLSGRRVVALRLKDGHPSSVALVWWKRDDCEDIQNFVGVARGRTRHSSR